MLIRFIKVYQLPTHTREQNGRCAERESFLFLREFVHFLFIFVEYFVSGSSILVYFTIYQYISTYYYLVINNYVKMHLLHTVVEYIYRFII